MTLCVSSSLAEDDGNRRTMLRKTSSRTVVSTAENETFLTGILDRLWPHISKVGCDIIRVCLAADSGMRFTKLDLGQIPVRLENVTVHETKPDGSVQFDADIIWNSLCEIKVKADYMGSFGVDRIELHGRMAFLLKPLTDVIPIASAVQYYFLNPPVLDLNFTGMAQVADISVLKRQVYKALDDTIGDMVVVPNRMLIKMDPQTSIFDMYEAPLGVLRVRLIRGSGFVIEKHTLAADDIPDVYCNIALGRSRLWRSTTVMNDLNPVWEGEFADFILFDSQQLLTVHAWDEDKGPMNPDDDVGKAAVSVQTLLLSDACEIPLFDAKDGKENGASITLQCSLLQLSHELLTSLTMQESSPQTIGGVLTVLINQAWNIPQDKQSTYVKAAYGDTVFTTAIVTELPEVDAVNPIFDAAFHYEVLTEKFQARAGRDDLVLSLMYGDGSAKDTLIGSTSVSHVDLVRAREARVREKRTLPGCNCSLEIQVQISGVDVSAEKSVTAKATPIKIASSLLNASTDGEEPVSATRGAIVPPTRPGGTIHLTVESGRGFKIQKYRMKKDDIPDVYVKVKIGSTRWKTSTIHNNTAPCWQESRTFDDVAPTDLIAIEAWDYDKGKFSTDDELGKAQVTVAKIVLAGGRLEVPLMVNGRPCGEFITLSCKFK